MEGSYLIIHLGSNNLFNRDGTERENSKTLIRNIISTWKQAKDSVIKDHVMDMVNSKKDITRTGLQRKLHNRYRIPGPRNPR